MQYAGTRWILWCIINCKGLCGYAYIRLHKVRTNLRILPPSFTPWSWGWLVCWDWYLALRWTQAGDMATSQLTLHRERKCRAPVKLITIPWWWHEMIRSHALGALDTLNNLVFGMASPPWAISVVQPQTADLYATSPQASLTRWHAQCTLLAVHSSRHHASLSHSMLPQSTVPSISCQLLSLH